MTTTDHPVHEDLHAEARRLGERAEAAGVPMALLGGVAIRLLLGPRMPAPLLRVSDDLDYLTDRRSARRVEQLLGEAGWEPDVQFNALNGARRLVFHDPPTGHKVDVFVDDFEMCHALPLRERLDPAHATLSGADLLLTKLQVVELNAKDRGDLYALLAGLEVVVGAAAHDGIDADRVAGLAARDWGLHHTVEANIRHLRDALGGSPLPPEHHPDVLRRLDALEAAMEAAPKSRGWRLRARVGERRRWYELPEEVER